MNVVLRFSSSVSRSAEQNPTESDRIQESARIFPSGFAFLSVNRGFMRVSSSMHVFVCNSAYEIQKINAVIASGRFYFSEDPLDKNEHLMSFSGVSRALFKSAFKGLIPSYFFPF